MKLERLEITAPVADERHEALTSRTVVQRRELTRYGDGSLGQALGRVPGVSIRTGPGRDPEILLRGLGSGYTQILLNGQAVPNGFSLESLSLEMVDRVEIDRVAMVDKGGQAIAGTINIVLRASPSQVQKSVKATLATERGQVSSYLDGLLSGGEKDVRSYSLAIAGSQENVDRPARIEEFGTAADDKVNLARTYQQRSRERIDVASVLPRATWKEPGGDSLSIEALLRSRRLDGHYVEQSQTQLGPPPTYAANDGRLNSNTHFYRTVLSGSKALFGDTKLDASLTVNHNRRTSRSTFLGFDDEATLILIRDVQSQATDRGLVTRGTIRTPFDGGQAFAFGWEGESSRRAEDRIQRDVTPTGLPPSNLDEVYDAEVRRAALFGQGEWESKSGQSAYYGLRWEKLTTTSAGREFEEVNNSSSVFSPVVQFRTKEVIAKGDQLRLGIARTYKAPTTVDLVARRYVSNNNTATSPDRLGNPDLRPELAWGLDVAYERSMGEGQLMSVGLFARRIDGVILRELTFANDRWTSQPINNGKASIRGLELEARVKAATMFSAPKGLTFHANATIARSRVDNVPGPDNRLDRQAPFTANVGFDHREASSAMSFGGNLSSKSVGRARLSNTQAESRSAKRMLDLYANWRIDKSAQLRVAVSNVLQDSDTATSSYFDVSSSRTEITTTPTRFAARATFEYRF